jgi:hypothetical protein
MNPTERADTGVQPPFHGSDPSDMMEEGVAKRRRAITPGQVASAVRTASGLHAPSPTLALPLPLDMYI